MQEVIVDHVEQRFNQSEIYTYIGEILLAVNPFTPLAIYTSQVRARRSIPNTSRYLRQRSAGKLHISPTKIGLSRFLAFFYGIHIVQNIRYKYVPAARHAWYASLKVRYSAAVDCTLQNNYPFGKFYIAVDIGNTLVIMRHFHAQIHLQGHVTFGSRPLQN